MIRLGSLPLDGAGRNPEIRSRCQSGRRAIPNILRYFAISRSLPAASRDYVDPRSYAQRQYSSGKGAPFFSFAAGIAAGAC